MPLHPCFPRRLASVLAVPALLLAMLSPVPSAASPDAPSGESARSFPAWFNERKAGMFIHWGLYSIPGNEWNGKRGKRDAHIQQEFRIPRDEYRKLLGQFNPTAFDAREYARLAKRAGLGYIVYVAKHHDGFAMYDSPSDPYNIKAATPFGRDPLAELARACREEGLVLCVYYSLGRDWAVPGAPLGGHRCNDWDFPDAGPDDYGRYIQNKVKPQLKEILTAYGPIGAIWFDTPEKTTPEQSRELRDWIKGLQPDCLINARIGNGFGDYDIHEQRIPRETIHRPWEACLTINNHWGFDRNDHQWKSPEMLVRVMIDIAAKGGNFLINIGPDGTGAIPRESVERLHALGDWMTAHGGSIRGTSASPFAATEMPGLVFAEINADGSEKNPAAGPGHKSQALPRGWRATAKPGAIYIHLFDRPQDTKLVLDGVQGTVRAVRQLGAGAASGAAAPVFTRKDGRLEISLETISWNPLATVLEIAIEDS